MLLVLKVMSMHLELFCMNFYLEFYPTPMEVLEKTVLDTEQSS